MGLTLTWVSVDQLGTTDPALILKIYVKRKQKGSFSANFADNRPNIDSQKVIADQGDSVNLTCTYTYTSNCKLRVSWSKDNVNELHPVYEKKIGNDTRSLTYVLQDAAKHFTSYSYSCFLEGFAFAVVELDVKGKIKSHTLFLSSSTCCQRVVLLHLHCLYQVFKKCLQRTKFCPQITFCAQITQNHNVGFLWRYSTSCNQHNLLHHSV